MPCPKGIGSRHKSGTWDNEDRQQTTPRDNRFLKNKYSNSKPWSSEGISCAAYLWNMPHLASLLDPPSMPFF